MKVRHCAQCGFLATRTAAGGSVIAGKRYRRFGDPSEPAALWSEPFCLREVFELKRETEETLKVLLSSDVMRSAWNLKPEEHLPNLSHHSEPKPRDYAATFARDRTCKSWIRWRPGKSLEDHVKMDEALLSNTATVVGIIGGILLAGSVVVGALIRLFR